MKPSIENIRTIVSVLTAEERQLLKDTFLYGGWGDTDYEFLDENGKTETVGAWGYCTNDAREGKHFAGRVVATMFRSIYAKLCPANRNQCGAHLSHCNDWWGDGSGDMLFVRSSWNKAWLEWARTPEESETKKETPNEECPVYASVSSVTTNGERRVELVYATGEQNCKRVYFTAAEFAKVVAAIDNYRAAHQPLPADSRFKATVKPGAEREDTLELSVTTNGYQVRAADYTPAELAHIAYTINHYFNDEK